MTERSLRVPTVGRCLTAVALGLFLASCGGGSPPASPSPVDATTLPLSVGDALRVTFSRESGLNGQFAVDETGTAGLPILGEVIVTGRPAAELKEDLERQYAERTRNQLVQVTYLRRVRVLGEVRNPGLYHVDPTMTFNDVLALAGGVTPTGKLNQLRVTRGGQVIFAGFDAAADAGSRLRSGDELFIPRTSWFSRNAAWLIGATISAVGVIAALAS